MKTEQEEFEEFYYSEEHKRYIFNEEKKSRSLFSKLLGNKLKELRKEKGQSQKQVSDSLFIPVSTYANWEQGRTEPCYKDLIDLVGYFEIEANELFDMKEIIDLFVKNRHNGK